MRSFKNNHAPLAAAAPVLLLLASGGAHAQQVVNLTASAATATMPDGQSVPMWGYSCGTAASGSTASCAALVNANAAVQAGTAAKSTGWSPVIITVPSGQDLQISLTNSLPGGVPTSLTIVGQLGGGLGAPGGFTNSPDHSNAQQLTWPTANPATKGTPPQQGQRVQSFGTEVASGQTTALTWTAPRPGTYLLESGTHPSIQGPMGLYGIVVVTCSPTDTTSGCATGTAYPGVAYSADVALLMSEVDPVQNTAVATAIATTGFAESNVFAGYVGTGNPLYHCKAVDGTPATDGACYPPAVNYTPTYYLINGRGFDHTQAASSLYSVPATVTSGNLLVRLVNAGLRMHVPSIVGSATGSANAPGATLVAEDGNVLPGVPRVQSEVFMPAGKTYDLMVNVPACTPVAPATTCTTTALPVYDRELSLSANTTARDAGMLAYIGANGASAPVVGSQAKAVAVADSYPLLLGEALTVADPARGVVANDINVAGVSLLAAPAKGTVVLAANGTFVYTPADLTKITPDSFSYCANGTVTAGVCSSGIKATVTLQASSLAGGVACAPASFTATVASRITVAPPGILAGCKDAAGLPLSIQGATASTPLAVGAATVSVDGGFAAPASVTSFQVKVQNGAGNTADVTVNITYPAGSQLPVTVVDGSDHVTPITDYRWIIEEDRTFYVDPNCTTNPLPQGCTNGTGPGGTGAPINFGTNFHSSYMPVVATGCTGPLSCGTGQTLLGKPVVCDVGNGICRAGTQQATTLPGDVPLDPTKRYYLSVLPGDAANPFIGGNQAAPANCAQGAYDPTTPSKLNTGCGHGMGGAPIAAPVCLNGTCSSTTIAGPPVTCTPAPCYPAVTVLTQPTPLPPGKISVFVYEDDYPLNGEYGAGGGGTVIAPQEPGLGGFQLTLFDQAGGTGDATGTPTYDMFNQPLTNSLDGTLDPITGLDACPISQAGIANPGTNSTSGPVGSSTAATAGITGMIVTCPSYESDGKTLSPMAGQAVVSNLYPGRYSVMAVPAADRIARGEEWLQTNTLDGQKAHDVFIRVGEPGYFQEFGPAGFHVSIGFANPAIINNRLSNAGKTGLCDPAGAGTSGGGGLTCNNTVKGRVTTARMSRTPDQRLYSSGDRQGLSFTQCYVALSDPDGAAIAFAKCDADGRFVLSNLPAGNWEITTFDQWNDQIIDGISQAVGLNCSPTAPTGVCGTPANSAGTTVDIGDIGAHQWQTNIYTRTFIDKNGDGVSNLDANGNPTELGLALAPTNVRFRDGSYSNFNNTDLNGYAGFNEVFPLFNWYVVETDTTNYKSTGTHVVYDAGGPVDGSSPFGTACVGSATNPCGNSTIGASLANTWEQNPLPADLSVPGSVYCASGADCIGEGTVFAAGTPSRSSTANHSTGRIDAPYGTGTYGWQGFIGQAQFIEWGKKPYASGETGGIHGHVVYASTRPFDDPQHLLQLSWEPLVPHVRVNLYREDVGSDGTPTLTLVDHTETSSFDDWAQGFRADGKPNMNCPGQTTSDPFYFAMQDQPEYLDWYKAQHGGTAATALPYHSQYKCFDGMHNWNQVQPAPYDGMYSFPSVAQSDPVSGRPVATNCTACVLDPDASDPYRYGGPVATGASNAWVNNASRGTPMLPPGKYVVEVVVPPGYELVKEEDKNILIGDNYIAPPVFEIPGLGGAVYILPDQASLSAQYNANNPQNATQNLGRIPGLPSHEGDTGSVESYWPCVGQVRQVPDYLSLFPQAHQVAPFAGAMRPLCDRKEVTLTEQASALVKFYVYTPTHAAAHFTGIVLDDFTAEFDPRSPQFGEKFAPSYLPVGVKDWAGNEVNRIYTDQFGQYNGLNYSTWEVNPPNPTGYGPTMMVYCMNDAGLANSPDPKYNTGYSQFCYELPGMPSQTGYFDTPVVPTAAFSEGYNHPDCALPSGAVADDPQETPAIQQVQNNLLTGPWVDVTVAAHAASVAFAIDGVDNNTRDRITTVSINGVQLIPTAQRCGTNVTCTAATQAARNLAMATAVAATINAGTGGYLATATAGPDNSATVALVAPLAQGAAANGRVLAVSANGVMISGSGLSLAGGVNPHTATTSNVLTVTALGDQMVDWYGYSGPSFPTAPFNQQKARRHYGFGNTPGTVTIGGVAVPPGSVTWSDAQLQVAVPAGLPACVVQQQGAPTPATCGELVITNANGKSTVDSVTVTVGGSAPTVVDATKGQTIQAAIDAANPGDLIVIQPGVYHEMLVMWKPVRLQGVGAASAIVDANAHPAAQLLDPWRAKIVCLFGLTPDGRPRAAGDTACTAGLVGATASTAVRGGYTNFDTMVVDRLPLEATLGWTSALNGNLAEQMIEPTLLGAYEGGAITVLGKGVKFPRGTAINDAFGAASATAAAFPAGTLLLSTGDCAVPNPYPTNFWCNPSGIDGLGIRDSSQGGGGVFVHGYAHNLQVANNRIYNNTGTMSGGITVGAGEHPDVQLAGAAVATDPVSCESSNVANTLLPFCFNMDVNIHHNAVTDNSSLGDELFSSTPAGAGGVTINTGSDYYRFTDNWVCGNLSTGDGAGVAHVGFTKNGTIARNRILFNQSTNPTIATNGGGLLLMGAPDADPTTCGVTNDQDCAAAFNIAPSDGTGPGLVVDANLVLGNSAESGSGGGIRVQGENGTDVVTFPDGRDRSDRWNHILMTNNIVANNVAGWDGGGVSLLDALYIDIVNNTIVSNDSTASSGTLFNTVFSPLASAPSPTGQVICGGAGTQSCPQPAGLVSLRHTPILAASLPANFSCAAGHGSSNGNSASSCKVLSEPLMFNNITWQNRSFVVGVSPPDASTPAALTQQNLVTLYNANLATAGGTASSVAAPQVNTGDCPAGASYWDIGVRGDTTPTNHGGGLLQPTYSVMTSTAGYDASNTSGAASLAKQYCNGSREPPQLLQASYTVQAGLNEANATPLPIFTLQPAATVDEGNNWVNLRYGPLALNDPLDNAVLADFHLQSGSSAIIRGTAAPQSGVSYPARDYFGVARTATAGAVDAGAVAYAGAPILRASLSFGGPTPALTTPRANTTTKVGTITVTNATGATVGPFTLTAAPALAAGTNNRFSLVTTGAGAGTCVNTLVLAPGASCTVVVQYAPGTSTTTRTASVVLTGTGAATPTVSSPQFQAN